MDNKRAASPYFQPYIRTIGADDPRIAVYVEAISDILCEWLESEIRSDPTRLISERSSVRSAVQDAAWHVQKSINERVKARLDGLVDGLALRVVVTLDDEAGR